MAVIVWKSIRKAQVSKSTPVKVAGGRWSAPRTLTNGLKSIPVSQSRKAVWCSSRSKEPETLLRPGCSAVNPRPLTPATESCLAPCRRLSEDHAGTVRWQRGDAKLIRVGAQILTRPVVFKPRRFRQRYRPIPRALAPVEEVDKLTVLKGSPANRELLVSKARRSRCCG